MMITRCYSCMNTFDSQYQICPHCGYNMQSGPVEPYHLTPGTIIQGRYIIGKVIGFGGFGTVYKTWDNVLNIAVAVKEYYPAGIAQRVPGTAEVIIQEENKEEYRKGIDKFIQEAVILSKFQENENIVNALSYFEFNNTAYIIMEYLEGCSLSDFLEKRGGSLDPQASVAVLLATIRALKAIHKEKIIHRDISPSNIYICKNGQIKLIDFGAARSTDDPIATMEEVELKPGYAPPEQYRNNIPQGTWTDIYSLGATIYRTLTGEIPMESVARQLNDTMKKPSAFNKKIPTYLDKVILRAMSLEPELRFKNVSEFETAIQKKRKVRTPEKEIKRRKQRRVRIIFAIVAILLIVGAYSYIRYRVEKLKEVLPETTLQVWMTAEDENEQILKKNQMELCCEEFYAEYPQISIQYTFFTPEEYADAINEAALLGETPELFEAGNLTHYEIFYAAREPSEVLDMVNLSDYYILSEKKEDILESKKLPVGLTVAIPVCNPRKMNEYKNAMDNSAYLFERGRTPVALLSLPEYYSAKTELIDSYRLLKKTYVDYSYEWCLGQSLNIGNKACADRLLYYLLGEQAQEQLVSVEKPIYLPIKKNILNKFITINPELDYIVNDLNSDTAQITEKNNISSIYDKEMKDKYQEIKKEVKSTKK